MKKLYTFVLLIFFGFIGNAQIINFPDPVFKALLLSSDTENDIAFHLKIDANSDGEIQVIEAASVYYLNIRNASLTSLVGIQYFTNLQYLFCDGNALTSLDVTALSNLVELICDNNDLTTLNVSGLNNLTRLVCYNNQISNLDVSGLQGLTNLQCFNNQMVTLNASNAIHLENLACNDNQLTSLNISGNLNLGYLNCSDNQLTSIDASGLNNLQSLYCSNNNLNSLNISGCSFLSYLICSNNQLTAIDLSDVDWISYFYCDNNQITSLEIPYTTYQLFVSCTNNELLYLSVKNSSPETTLNFSGNPNLHFVCADEDEITTVENKIIEYGYSNCVLNSYCSFTPGGIFYTVNGDVKFDTDNNGCDATDNFASNIRFAVTGSPTVGTLVSASSGSYNLPLESGTHSITPQLENPNYFSVSPTNVTVSFPTTASPLTQNFCIAPNGTHNDLEIVVLPLDQAMPGFDVEYGILIKNKGNTTQNGIVNFNFDDAILDLVSSSPLYNNQSSGNLSWNFTNLQPFESRYINVVLNINGPMETPPVIGGVTLDFTGTIIGTTDETPDDNTFALHQGTVISYDPNDKTCLEGTTVGPEMVGKYVHYIIRFENTGTANAQNIVVTDHIDTSKFNLTSLVPELGSHNYSTRINGNKVEFIFENINLPFDNATNDGYVAFKIKTKPTLQIGDTFSNNSNIYFDYNFPIVTNTYVTTIQTLGNQDFEFSSVFSLSPVPTKDMLTITTKENVVMSSINIYNTLGQLVQVNTNPNETIDVSNLQNGTYFIKIMSDKGTAASKFIKE